MFFNDKECSRFSIRDPFFSPLSLNNATDCCLNFAFYGLWNGYKCGLVYEIPCRDCDAVYVGETGRNLNTRKKITREGCERDELTKVRLMSTRSNL